MSDIERFTVALTAEMAKAVRGAVKAGDYASSSEIVREALRDWRAKREAQSLALGDLRSVIAEGLRDIAEGRVSDFDAGEIKRRGRELSAKAEPSG